MKKFLLFTINIVLIFSIRESVACVRADLADRAPAEVVAKAKSLGSSQAFGNVTGALWFDGVELASGIALDPYTVLTAAHPQKIADPQNTRFNINPNAFHLATRDFVAHPTTIRPIIYPDFKRRPHKRTNLTITDKEHFCNDLPLEDVGQFNFEQFNAAFTGQLPFTLPDLAIIKLSKPLPRDFSYPEIFNNEGVIENRHAVTIGYGEMFYNEQDRGPQHVTLDPKQGSIRHLVSNHVNSGMLGDGHVFYGHYKGLLVNGFPSFIPEKTMLKTEGLPTDGFSGAPLFMEDQDGVTRLAGIFAGYRYLLGSASDPNIKEFAGFVQPIFPIWTDIRYYKDWIQAQMGKPKTP